MCFVGSECKSWKPCWWSNRGQAAWSIATCFLSTAVFDKTCVIIHCRWPWIRKKQKPWLWLRNSKQKQPLRRPLQPMWVCLDCFLIPLPHLQKSSRSSNKMPTSGKIQYMSIQGQLAWRTMMPTLWPWDFGWDSDNIITLPTLFVWDRFEELCILKRSFQSRRFQ